MARYRDIWEQGGLGRTVVDRIDGHRWVVDARIRRDQTVHARKEDHAPMAPLLHPLTEQPAEDEGGGERLIEGALELVGGQCSTDFPREEAVAR